MTDYKPGTVAKVKPYIGTADEVGILTEAGTWATANGSFLNVSDVRPLVVLELKHPDGMLRTLREAAAENEWISDPLTNIADQIEAQTKPPRIPEPGLWAVVEARLTGYNDRTRFVHHAMSDNTAAAWHETGGGWWNWDDLIDPVLIREGVDA